MILALMLWRCARDTETQAPTSAPAPDAHTGSVEISPKPPALADATPRGSDQPALLPPPTPRGIYANEARDEEWATATEAALHKRFMKIRGSKLQAVACHETVCELVVGGTKGDVAQTVADLEGARGIHDISTGQFLTAPEQQSDGSIVLRIYASFAR